MKILHVITTLDVGGAEMHLLSQVRGQAQRGHQPSVCYLKGQGSLRADFLAVGAQRVEHLSLGPAFPWRLGRWARSQDIVHTHLLKADMAVAAISGLSGWNHKLVSSKHNDEQVLRRPWVSHVHGCLGRAPRRTIVLSDHVGRFIERYGRIAPERLQRIYYGLDPSPFLSAAQASPAEHQRCRQEFGFAAHDVIAICVARFAAQKAHSVLLRAFAQARQQDPRLALLLVGDDPFGSGRTQAEALAQALGLGARCVFAGIRRDVPRLVAASDVFVMSSLWEGLGLVFLEAMAAGKPVLSTQVSAIPEVVVAGETGLLVPPGEVEPLAQALVRLGGDPKLREQLGLKGRQRVLERFNLDRMVEETLAVYRSLL